MIKNLGVKRLIGIFLDTEANGLNYKKHEPVEIAIELINLETGKRIDSYNSLIHISSSAFEKSDPNSLAFTGITYEELKKGKDILTVKKELLNFFLAHHLERKKALFICQNPSFDRIFFSKIIDPDLQEEKNFPYNWLDLASMQWSRLLREGNVATDIQLSKDLIAKHYGIPPEQKPHRAKNGVRHLIECYKIVVGFNCS